MGVLSKLSEKIQSKLDAWSASNEAAAERYRAERLLLKEAREELEKNEQAIDRAEQILLRERLTQLDEKLAASDREENR